jgi:predicted nucleic acid-binding Zn ribbon protein
MALETVIEPVEMICPACGIAQVGTMTHCMNCRSALASAIHRPCSSCGTINIGVQWVCVHCRLPLPLLSSLKVPHIAAGHAGGQGAAPAAALCPQCGNALKPGKSFCTACGFRLTAQAAQPVVAPAARQCPTCSRAVPADKKFCTACGTRL